MKKTIPLFLIFALFVQIVAPGISFAQTAFETNEKTKITAENSEEEIKSFPKKKTKPVELTNKRKQNEKTYLNPDGTFTTETYSEPIHWKGKNGLWNKIDNSVVEDSNEILTEEELKNNSNAFDVRLKKNIKTGNFMKVSFEDYDISLSPLNVSKSKAEVKENQSLYKDVYNETDFRYTFTSTGVKEEIILKNKTAPTQFQFEIQSSELTPKLKKNEILFYDENEKLIFSTDPLFAYDNKEHVNRDLELTLKKEGKKDKWLLTIALNENWIAEEERAYPITIDPTINVQFNDKQLYETFVYEGSKTSNYHDFSYIRAGNNGYGEAKSLLNFDLPQLPSGAKIVAAKLDLYSYSASNPTNALQVYEVITEWDEKTATWSKQPTYSTNPFIDSVSNGTSTTIWMTPLVDSWYTGKKKKNGIMIQTKKSSDAKHEFLSTENPNSLKNPKMTITYKIDALGIEDFWAFDNGVNLHSGNYVTGATDYNLFGRGVPIGISRSYNNQSDESSLYLGDNWRFDFEMRLSIDKFTKLGDTITFTDEDGTNHVFVYDSDKNKYITPPEIQLELYKTSDGIWEIKDVDQTIYSFTIYGYLNHIKDKNGNITDYQFDGEKVKLIKDDSGRTIYIDTSDSKQVKITGDKGIMPYDIIYTLDDKKRLISAKKINKTTLEVIETKYEYSDDNLIAIIDNAKNRTEILYDSEDKAIAILQYVTNSNNVVEKLTTSYSYQETTSGKVVVKTNPNGIKTKFTINENSNLEKVEDDYNSDTGKSVRSVSYVWDENNRLAKIIDPKNNETVISYDNNGNTEEIQNAKGYKTLMKYDKNRNLTQYTGFSGETVKNYYDDKENQISTVSMTSSGNITEYNENGNITKNSNPLSIGNNLIRNSGFEEWTGKYPDYWFDFTGENKGVITKDTVNKVNGKQSLKLYSAGSNDIVNIVSEPIPVYGNISYNLSWNVKTNNLKNAEIYVRYIDSNHQFLSEKKIADIKGDVGSGAIRQSTTIDIDNEYVWYVKIQIKVNGGTVWLDNFQLQESAFVDAYDVTTNNSFESDHNQDGHPDNWIARSELSATDGIDKTTEKSGDNSVMLVGGTLKEYRQEFYIPGKKGDKLIWSGHSKASNVSSTGGSYDVLMRIDYDDGTNDWISAPFNRGTHDWEFSEKSHAAKKDYKGFAVYIRLKDISGKAWFDDIQVKKEMQGNPMVSEYNILQNGSFEMYDYAGAGTNYGWTLTENQATILNDKTKAFIGNNYGELRGSPTYTLLSYFTTEPVKTDKKYTFSAMVKREGIAGNEGYLKIRYYDENGVKLGDVLSKELVGSSKDWERVAVTFDPKKYPSAKLIKPFFEMEPNSTGKLLVDAARFEEQGTFSEFSYDTLGNYVTSVTDEMGDKTSYEVDTRGNIKRIDYSKTGLFAEYQYDWLDRLISVKDSSNLRNEYIYEEKTGNLLETKFFNDKNSEYLSSLSYTYNEFGEVTSSTERNGEVTNFSYDKLGNITDVYLPNGKNTHYTFNSSSEVTDITFTGDDTTWHYEYDVSGNTTKIVKNNSEITKLEYDQQTDEIKNIIYPTINGAYNKIGFKYTPSGSISVLTPSFKNYNNQNITYMYYDSGSFKGLKGSEGQEYELIYDEQTRTAKTTLILPNGKKSLNYYQYNDKGFIEEHREEDSKGQVVRKDKFNYDLAGNITKILHLDLSYSLFTYDFSNQLKSEKHYTNNGSLISESSYTYDVLGNRLNVNVNGETTIFDYDVANQLTTVNGILISHDENGNRTNDKKHNYTYNAVDQLTAIDDKKGNVIAKYEYEDNGLRSKKTINGKTLNYYYIGDKLTYITDEQNSMLYSFTRGTSGQLLTMTDHSNGNSKGTIYEYVLNYRGDVLGLRDEIGNMIVQYNYDSWGNILESTGSKTLGNGKLLKDENPFRYASYMYDSESGLYYINQRYYDSNNGRFLTRDVVSYDNLYAYVGNNPISFVDPTGNSWKSVGNFFKSAWNGIKEVGSVLASSSSKAAAKSKGKPQTFPFYFIGSILVEDVCACDINPKTKSVKTTTPSGLKYKTSYGSNGEITSITAKVEKSHLKTGTSTNQSSRDFIRNLGYKNDDAGHLIAKNLGGLGGVSSHNLIPQSITTNRGSFRSYEKAIYNEVNAGKSVHIRIKPLYNDGSTRPYGVIYQARIDGNRLPDKYFQN